MSRVASWMSRAACVGHDPEIWFQASTRAQAQRICAGCPVAGDCRVRGAEEYRGVWGGGVHMRKSVGPSPSLPYINEQPCGTEGGYARHLRDDQPPCGRCTIAHRFRNAGQEGRVSA